VGDAARVAMSFAGVTSPARNMVGVLVATRRMVDRARSGDFQRVLVNTGGLVAGEGGRLLKQAKIDWLDPDLVIALAPPGQLASILRPYEGRARPRILDVPPLPAPRRRSPCARARFRAERLDRALEDAVALRLAPRTRGAPGGVVLDQPPLFAGEPLAGSEPLAAERATGRRILHAERHGDGIAVVSETRPGAAECGALSAALGVSAVHGYGLDEMVGMLAGLEDTEGELRGLGIVSAIDFAARTIDVRTAVPAGRIAVVTIGREGLSTTRCAESP
jgi:polynucleotide 5'-kinase involved in rRNA processing